MDYKKLPAIHEAISDLNEIETDIEATASRTASSLSSIYKDFIHFIKKSPAIPVGFGIITGSMFTSLINSLTNDIIIPPIGDSLINSFIVLKQGKSEKVYNTLEEAKEDGAITENFGSFLNSVLYFLIVSFTLYILFRIYSLFSSKTDQKECSECCELINIKAKRCPFCTSTQ